MHDRFPWLLAAVLGLLVALGAFFLRASERGAFADKLSTFRSEPDGARALYLLARARGLPVERRTDDFSGTLAPGTLVLLGQDTAAAQPEVDGGTPQPRPEKTLGLTEEEQTWLMEWVEGGGTLVYAPSAPGDDDLLEAIEVGLVAAPAPGALQTLVPAQPAPLTRGVERLEAELPFALQLPADAIPMLVEPRTGAVAAAWVRNGDGAVLVLSAAELAMNRALARADNAQFWVSTLSALAPEGGPLWFDEYHHGFTGQRSVGAFARKHALWVALLQGMFALAAWTFARRRFGPPRALARESLRAQTDAVSATSRLYQEANHRVHTALVHVNAWAGTLARHHGLPKGTVSAQAVAAALETRGLSEPAAELETLRRWALAARSDTDVLKVAKATTHSRLARLSRRRSIWRRT